MAAKALSGKVRIIGGRWRGRKLEVPDSPGLRPTPDRVRETLFNWLGQWLEGCQCLDLFAGSGALGFEALSRGAASVVCVDREPRVCRALREQAQRLGAADLRVVQADATTYCADALGQDFDLVFLDPPFGQDLVAPSFQALEQGRCLAPGARVYLETERALGDPDLPAGWHLYRSAGAGQVRYHLAIRDDAAL